MKVVIVGGSNSLKKDGWTSFLPAMVPGVEIINQSIGAAPTLMGYYRLVTGVKLDPGDIVIWEYALNDEAKIKLKTYSAESAHRHLEMTIRYASSMGAFFIPVVFAEIENSDNGRKNQYLAGLAQLFSTYGLIPVSAVDLYCAAHNVDRIPMEEFQNRKHYSVSSDVVQMVVKAVAEQIFQPVAPKSSVAPIFFVNEPELFFADDFTGGRQFEFKNSIVYLKVHEPLVENPLLLKVPTGTWTVLGAIVLRSKDPRLLDFEFDRLAVLTSLSYRSRNHSRPMLGFRQFATGSDIIVTEGSQVRIARPERTMKRNRRMESDQPDAENDDHGVICLILEPRKSLG